MIERADAPRMEGAIFEAMSAVMADIPAIPKGRMNQQQHYQFRGIDDVYRVVHDVLAKHKVFCAPSVKGEVVRDERPTKTGGTLIYTTLKVQHRFYTTDGSYVDVVTVGEAMDSGDKSTNKAMSAAMKYAMLEVFAIPVDDDNDTENHSPQPLPKPTPAKPKPAPTAEPPSKPPTSGAAYLVDESESHAVFGNVKVIASTAKALVIGAPSASGERGEDDDLKAVVPKSQIDTELTAEGEIGEVSVPKWLFDGSSKSGEVKAFLNDTYKRGPNGEPDDRADETELQDEDIPF